MISIEKILENYIYKYNKNEDIRDIEIDKIQPYIDVISFTYYIGYPSYKYRWSIKRKLFNNEIRKNKLKCLMKK